MNNFIRFLAVNSTPRNSDFALGGLEVYFWLPSWRGFPQRNIGETFSNFTHRNLVKREEIERKVNSYSWNVKKSDIFLLNKSDVRDMSCVKKCGLAYHFGWIDGDAFAQWISNVWQAFCLDRPVLMYTKPVHMLTDGWHSCWMDSFSISCLRCWHQ